MEGEVSDREGICDINSYDDHFDTSKPIKLKIKMFSSVLFGFPLLRLSC